ncbi:hypothetical protein LZK98_08150 [Sphingomonas cannabina]|uniref:hypothetical protein n=1 Tax=Sphingomonas cannabina TaxID=2899123 RepID=UPI001F376975|nr:hypothetical protein [Sphingomonas cannabina]UIJ46900.1 hypothetical protein LZK98_08150 [Sphingomonas cannabina]
MVDWSPILLAKKELVYAQDAAPTAEANAFLTRNFQRQPIVTDRLERNLDRPVRGGSPDAATNARQTYSFEVEMAGSGAAGTAAPWMELHEACGMLAPVLTAGATAIQKFAPIGVALSSLTSHSYIGTELAKSLGARGTFGWNITAGSYPFWNYEFTGLLPPPGSEIADAVPGEPDLDRWIDPLEVNTANTEFTLDGFALVMQSFTGAVNAEIATRNLVGANYIRRGNHAITGQIVGVATTITAKNYYASLRSGAQTVLAFTHGIVAGNIVGLDMAHVQITAITVSNDGGEMMVTISYRANVGTTNDDLIITVK